MSQIITFYSYKGGVGRSLALVNVATLLSKWGKKVLMIDWDLEAPGLENFFEPYIKDVDWSKQKGILDFLWAKQKKQSAPWQDWVVPITTKVSTTPLHLLVSGKSNGEYSDQLRAFNVSQFYKNHDGAHVIEDFRKALLDTYDYVLIDSRTGVTDFGGICTIQMPDILVMLLTATEQGLNGTARIAEKAQNAHAALPFDREKLLIMPVPARIDQSEYTLTQEWLNKIATRLKPFYEDWIPANIDINEFMRLIKIPYIPYFSYGEKLPVIEQGVSDPAGLGYAYENLGMLLAREVETVDEFILNRELYLYKTILSQEAIGKFMEEVKKGKYEKELLNIALSEVKESSAKYSIKTPTDPLKIASGGLIGAQLGRLVGLSLGTVGPSLATVVSIGLPILGVGTAIWSVLSENDKSTVTKFYEEAIKKALSQNEKK